MATNKKDRNIDLPEWQNIVSAIVVDKEYRTDQSNMQDEHQNMESVLDMLICDRAEKEYDWQSDIFIPDFPSIHWTQMGELVNQYFSRWEKVDCPPSTTYPEDVLKAKAAKTFINYHLNARYMHYLQKFIRENSFNRLGGWCVLKLWYESDIEMEDVQVGVQSVPRSTGVDIYGDPVEESSYPERMEIEEQPVYQQVKRINTDRPNFDVWPNQDVFFDNKYAYSLQDKDHVIFRSEEKLDDLRKRADMCQYFNLDLLEQEFQTDTEEKTYNKKDDANKRYDRIVQKWNPDIEILERWGKWPILLDEQGNIAIDQDVMDAYGVISAKSGIDDDGNMLPNAVIVPTIITIANIKSGKIPIRFQPNLPEYGGYGFIPAVRFQCYIHPTKDRGIGDGRYAKELQVAINDTFNMNNDRTRIATFPTMKKRKYAMVDNDTIMFGPEHIMELENMDDVDIFEVSDNIQGGLIQQDMLWSKMQQVLATWQHDMGGMPTRKEPVTTTMLAEQKSNIRNNLVNLTVEHTGLGEFYDMLLKMSGLFMQPETLAGILEDLTPWFDPEPEYNFVPVSTAILTEHAKESKIQMWDQILGRLVNVPNPRTFTLINLIMKEILDLYGKEYSQYGDFLLDENAPHPELLKAAMQMQTAQQQQGQKRVSRPKPQNQYGNRQTSLEQRSRSTGTAAGGGQR